MLRKMISHVGFYHVKYKTNISIYIYISNIIKISWKFMYFKLFNLYIEKLE